MGINLEIATFDSQRLVTHLECVCVGYSEKQRDLRCAYWDVRPAVQLPWSREKEDRVHSPQHSKAMRIFCTWSVCCMFLLPCNTSTSNPAGYLHPTPLKSVVGFVVWSTSLSCLTLITRYKKKIIAPRLVCVFRTGWRRVSWAGDRSRIRAICKGKRREQWWGDALDRNRQSRLGAQLRTESWGRSGIC